MEFVTPPTTPKKVRCSSHMGRSQTLRSPNKPSFVGFDDHGIENKSNRSSVEQKSPIRLQERKRTLDRFIPSREAMDFDAINSELTNESDRENSKSDMSPHTPGQANYKKRLDLLKTRQDGDKILSFSADKNLLSPLGDKPDRLLDMSTPGSTLKSRQGPRSLPTCPCRILDAPELSDDYYLNLLSWSKDNIIAIGLKNSLYLWNASDGSNQKLMTLDGPGDVITSVQWSSRDSILSIGTNTNAVQLWDISKSVCLRQMGGHTSRVSALSWKDSLLSSGGRDSVILNHDIRARNHVQFKYAGHQQEVCGLKWSPDGTTLASGGNENLLCLWDQAMSVRGTEQAVDTYSPRITIAQHQAAVKALAWCPFIRNTLASGGGTADRTIRIWNTSSGTNLKCVDTGSQVCAIQWSEAYRELVSSHGFSDNQLCLWKYQTMTKMKEFRSHNARVLHMDLSPDGSTIVSAGADESIRFWEIFSGANYKSSPSSTGQSSPLRKSLSCGFSLR